MGGTGSGRKQPPAAILKQQGKFRKDRHADDLIDPKAETSKPAPDTLGDEGKRIWNTYRDMFIQNGVLTEMDNEAFYLLCETFDNVEFCRQELTKEGVNYMAITQRGVARHPLANQRDAFVKEQFKLLSLFGMAPSERGGIHIKGGESKGFRQKPA